MTKRILYVLAFLFGLYYAPVAAQEIDVSPVDLSDGLEGRFALTVSGSYDVIGDVFSFAPSVGHEVGGHYWFGAGPRLSMGRGFAQLQLAYSWHPDAETDGEDGEGGVFQDLTRFSLLAAVGMDVLGPFGVIVRADLTLPEFEGRDWESLIPTAGIYLRL